MQSSSVIGRLSVLNLGYGTPDCVAARDAEPRSAPDECGTLGRPSLSSRRLPELVTAAHQLNADASCRGWRQRNRGDEVASLFSTSCNAHIRAAESPAMKTLFDSDGLRKPTNQGS